MLEETGLLNIILPEMVAMKGIEQRQKFHHKDVFNHTLEVLDNVAKQSTDLKLRLAAIFHDIAKPRTKRFEESSGWTFHGHEVVGKRMTGAILRKMKFSADIVKFVQKLVSLHLRPMALVNEEVTDSAVRRLIFLAGDDLDDLIALCRADITSKNIERVKKYIANYDRVVKKIHEVEERDRIRNFQPPVDGNEIMKLFDIEEGPAIGRIKKFLEEAILNGDVPNDHDACINLIMEHRAKLL
jgi:poly(A) polymerase